MNQTVKGCLTAALAALLTGSVQAQDYVPAYLRQPRAFITANFDIADPSGWLQARKEAAVPFTGFIAQHKGDFGMGADDDFVLVKTTADDYPFMDPRRRMTHHRYNQTYKGLMVEYAELFLHHKDDRIQLINAKLAEGLDFPVTPAVTEAAALAAAISYLGDTNTYTWQDTAWEAEYKAEKEDPAATTYPVGELLVAKKEGNQDYSSSQFVLAYKFKITSLRPLFSYMVYIDANTGAIVKKVTTIQTGNADLSYGYGTKNIDTKWRGGSWSHFILNANDVSGRDIYTKKVKYNILGEPKRFGGDDKNNSFDNDDRWYDDRSAETTPHWAMTETWNYFKSAFGRVGFENKAHRIKIYVQRLDFANASFGGEESDVIYFGSIDGKHMGTRDVSAHEYTHGVTKYTSRLGIWGESGALNESFSDIFAYGAERYMNGGVHTNWTINEDVKVLRKMDNPFNSPTPQPAVYLGANWYEQSGCIPDPGLNDNCGIHINSGVQNYWFYLLTEGSAGAPDGTYKDIKITGIGADKAARITYYNLDNFIGENAGFADARNGAFFAAGLVYGTCSEEQKQTKNAWAAVGIGNPIGALKIEGPSVVYYNASGAVLGGMPKVYRASGGEGRNTWAYTGPWSYKLPGGMRSDRLEITDFKGKYTAGTIIVKNGCESSSKAVRFICTDCEIKAGTGAPYDIKISPNPTGGAIHVEADFLDPASGDPIYLSILDRNGDYVFQQSYEYPLPQSIDISALDPGTYSLILHQGQVLGYENLVKQ